MTLEVVARFGAEVAMIDIQHEDTDALRLQIEGYTLAGRQSSDAVLQGADLHGADLRGIQSR